jgi:G3E family GTPase
MRRFLMKVKVDIFSGFLGAGKTTLIKKLLEEKALGHNVAIIENEFGKVGIDGSILRNSSIKLKEINSGCICCSVSGDFSSAIKEVIDNYKPSKIIIEPTGVSKLSEIINICKSKELRELIDIDMIATVIDPLNFHMYIKNFSEFYKNQIISADSIILSRTQKLDNASVTRVVAEIRKLNEKASVVTTPWDVLDGNKIVDMSKNDKNINSLKKINLVKKPANSANIQSQVRSNHSANETFQTFGVQTPKVFSEVNLKNILKKLSSDNAYGTVLRAKGIVQVSGKGWVQFDHVPGEVQFKNIAPDCTGRICVIGSNLNKVNLEKLFLA